MNIYLYGWLHPKNLNAIKSYKSINIITDSNQIDKCDIIYCPSNYINPDKYPNKIFIFGPHFSVFPNEDYVKLLLNHKNKCIYTQPSQWAKDVWINMIPHKNDIIRVLPFGVDTERFSEIQPIDNRHSVFIYYKSRNPNELKMLENFLGNNHVSYRIFSYDQKYSENDYLEYLQKSKYGIVLDRHESQGFALEEALSCNVPLLVWDATNMNQELNQNYPSIAATSIPYWDSRCGEYFYEYSDLDSKFKIFLERLDTYRPREFILENLSIDKCEQKLISLINSLKQ